MLDIMYIYIYKQIGTSGGSVSCTTLCVCTVQAGGNQQRVSIMRDIRCMILWYVQYKQVGTSGWSASCATLGVGRIM